METGTWVALAGDEKNVLVIIKCVSCGKIHEVKAPVAGLIARENGALIQVAFPKMSAGERELFVSGICDDCFPKEDGVPYADDADADERTLMDRLNDAEEERQNRCSSDPAAELNADEIEGDKLGDDPSNWY